MRAHVCACCCASWWMCGHRAGLSTPTTFPDTQLTIKVALHLKARDISRLTKSHANDRRALRRPTEGASCGAALEVITVRTAWGGLGAGGQPAGFGFPPVCVCHKQRRERERASERVERRGVGVGRWLLRKRIKIQPNTCTCALPGICVLTLYWRQKERTKEWGKAMEANLTDGTLE